MRQAGATAELEITPAMVEAGAVVLECNASGLPEDLLAEEVYRAMHLASLDGEIPLAQMCR